ncbi:Heterokaryon incompatibility protein 6, OR allele [Madurella mycetomatis]|uniref:Heterokaryon incompatibility protein 6, OR allele n=1 Tax=Madurella mycetomatis TaxID=100816 RepID=A0A175VW10_9PEZI|nr:Heterokaryon incompatibility protein 6, OR allele [Madurella mycetomatis]
MSDPSPIRTIPNDYLKYHELDPASREIRLLHVVPAQTHSNPAGVSCILFKTSLDDCPQFRALVSRDGGGAERVTADSSEQLHRTGQSRITDSKVTTNLYSVLRALSLEEDAGFIWADMLCINQGDPVERSAQVMLMKAIYTNATRTQRIAGSLDLATDTDPSTFRPDYTKSLAETYRYFTEWLILQHGHLEILSFVRNTSPGKPAALPSWVPDFRYGIQGKEWRLAEMCRNRGAVVPTLTAASKLFDRGRLCLRGRCLAVVKRVISLQDFRLSGMEDANAWGDIGIDKIWMMLFICEENPRRSAQVHAGTAEDVLSTDTFSLLAFLRTMLVAELDGLISSDEAFIARNSRRLRELVRLWGKLDPRFRSLSRCPRDVLRYWQLHRRLVGQSAVAIAKYDQHIHYMVLRRSFFFATDERLGLCPEGTRAGDVVVALDGGATPFVVREASSHGTLRDWLVNLKVRTWEFIGECYLQDAMQIQGWTRRDWGWQDPL